MAIGVRVTGGMVDGVIIIIGVMAEEVITVLRVEVIGVIVDIADSTFFGELWVRRDFGFKQVRISL
jgi:hypothetical protein